MFNVGDYVIYKRDLCKLQKVETSPRTGELYYKLSPIEDETLLINVPASNKFNFLRYPITQEEAQNIIGKIPNIEPLEMNDKLLEQEYRALLKTNTHEDLIKIIKTTYLRNEIRKNAGKKASDKDLDFFNQAEKYLYNELGFALGMNYEECKNYIISLLSQKEEPIKHE